MISRTVVTTEPAGPPSSPTPYAEWGLIAAVAAAAALAIVRAGPPSARGPDAPTGEFSAARAFEHVKEIARAPHPAGSTENARVREWLAESLRGLGLEVAVLDADGSSSRYSGPVHNVVGRLRGRASTGAVLVVAHYDSARGAPGAADDGAAVAAILETLRALRAGPPLQNDLTVLLTDGEEMGLLGAKAYVADRERLADVRVVLNWEARGSSGKTLMFETSEGAARLVAEYAAAVPRPAANSLMAEVYRRMPNDTDFSVFRRAGVPGLNFAFIGGCATYHMRADTPENLSLESLEDHGDTMLALVRRFGDLDLRDLAAAPPSDSVYFDVLGSFLVRYPASWVWPLTTAAAVLLAFALVRLARRGGASVRGVAASCGMAVAGIAVSCGAAYGLSQAILAVFAGRVSHPAAGTAGDAWFFLGMTLVALGVATFVHARFSRRLGVANLAGGALLLWFVLLSVSSALIPGGTFLFLGPLVLASLGALAGPRPWVAALAGAVVATLAAPMAQRMFVAMTLTKTPVAVALVAALFALLVPLAGPPSARGGRLLPLAALAAAGISLAVGSVVAAT